MEEWIIHFCQHVAHNFAVVFRHVQQLRPRKHVVKVVLPPAKVEMIFNDEMSETVEGRFQGNKNAFRP